MESFIVPEGAKVLVKNKEYLAGQEIKGLTIEEVGLLVRVFEKPVNVKKTRRRK